MVVGWGKEGWGRKSILLDRGGLYKSYEFGVVFVFVVMIIGGVKDG